MGGVSVSSALGMNAAICCWIRREQRTAYIRCVQRDVGWADDWKRRLAAPSSRSRSACARPGLRQAPHSAVALDCPGHFRHGVQDRDRGPQNTSNLAKKMRRQSAARHSLRCGLSLSTMKPARAFGRSVQGGLCLHQAGWSAGEMADAPAAWRGSIGGRPVRPPRHTACHASPGSVPRRGPGPGLAGPAPRSALRAMCCAASHARPICPSAKVGKCATGCCGEIPTLARTPRASIP